jgi:hypothetical protein
MWEVTSTGNLLNLDPAGKPKAKTSTYLTCITMKNRLKGSFPQNLGGASCKSLKD